MQHSLSILFHRSASAQPLPIFHADRLLHAMSLSRRQAFVFQKSPICPTILRSILPQQMSVSKHRFRAKPQSVLKYLTRFQTLFQCVNLSTHPISPLKNQFFRQDSARILQATMFIATLQKCRTFSSQVLPARVNRFV